MRMGSGDNPAERNVDTRFPPLPSRARAPGVLRPEHPLAPSVMHIAEPAGTNADGDAASEPSATPTAEAYGELQDAYDYYNRALFSDQLPACLITLQRRSRRTLGYFSHSRFRSLRDGRAVTDEIALNPVHFERRAVSDVLSTLAHEMVHLWQAHFGTPSRSRYHNKEWAARMESVGLMPSNTGKPGGKRTGQQMTHYVIAGGRFEKATAILLGNGFRLSWADALARKPVEVSGDPDGKSGSRIRYTCPNCAANAWGKSGLKLICGDCSALMHGHDRASTCD